MGILIDAVFGEANNEVTTLNLVERRYGGTQPVAFESGAGLRSSLREYHLGHDMAGTLGKVHENDAEITAFLCAARRLEARRGTAPYPPQMGGCGIRVRPSKLFAGNGHFCGEAAGHPSNHGSPYREDPSPHRQACSVVEIE